MFSALIITFRETLEASLVISIIFAYLNKSGNQKHKKIVWYGVVAGIVLSLVLAFVFKKYLGGFEGTYEQLYEGIVMLVAAALITWMVLWMMHQKSQIRSNLEKKMDSHIKKNQPSGLFLLTFVSVAREGIETVIFLQAALIQSEQGNVFIGGVIGVIIAIILSYILYKSIEKISLKKFFTITGIILVLFAAGLLAHGVHELQEAHILPTFIEHLWNINGFISEDGQFGGLLKHVFGYNGNPSLLEVSSYIIYLGLIGIGWKKLEK